MLTPSELTSIAVSAVDSKKALDICVLKTTDVTILADYFVICTASSSTHLKTLSDEIERALEEVGETLLRREGDRYAGWVLIDFGCLIVHLFLSETREFYSLERLWSDAENVDISEYIS